MITGRINQVSTPLRLRKEFPDDKGATKTEGCHEFNADSQPLVVLYQHL